MIRYDQSQQRLVRSARKTRSPRTMYGCRPPRYGPSKPSARSRLTSSGQETGPSLSPAGIRAHALGRPELDAAHRRDREAAAEPDDEPAVEGLGQVAAALRLGPARGPDAAELGDLAVPRLLVLDLLEPGGSERGGDILDDHPEVPLRLAGSYLLCSRARH